MKSKLVLELVWWLITGIIVLVVLYPIISVAEEYTFWQLNVLFVVIFVTLTRHIFLLDQTFLEQMEWLKITLVLVSPILIFLLAQEIGKFQFFADEHGWEEMFGIADMAQLKRLTSYAHTEVLFFGVGSVIGMLVLPIRLIISVWRSRNKKKVL